MAADVHLAIASDDNKASLEPTSTAGQPERHRSPSNHQKE
jgi:hypothetical protein